MNELADVDKPCSPNDYEENWGGKFNRLDSQSQFHAFDIQNQHKFNTKVTIGLYIYYTDFIILVEIDGCWQGKWTINSFYVACPPTYLNKKQVEPCLSLLTPSI